MCIYNFVCACISLSSIMQCVCFLVLYVACVGYCMYSQHIMQMHCCRWLEFWCVQGVKVLSVLKARCSSSVVTTTSSSGLSNLRRNLRLMWKNNETNCAFVLERSSICWYQGLSFTGMYQSVILINLPLNLHSFIKPWLIRMLKLWVNTKSEMRPAVSLWFNMEIKRE